MKKKVYDFEMAVFYLKDMPLGDMLLGLKAAMMNLSNAGLTSDKQECRRLILEAQSAAYDVTEFLDSIVVKEVEQ